jgi:hypothetical protein
LDRRAFGESYDDVRTELRRIAEMVPIIYKYDAKWCNDEVSVFLMLLNDAGELVDRSKLQGIELYGDSNLVVYPVLWEWVLARKLKRLQMEGQVQRAEVWSDCAANTMLLYNREGGRLSRDILKQFDHTEREPPVFDDTIAALVRWVLHYHLVQAF